MTRFGDSFVCPEANTMLDAIRAAGRAVSVIAHQELDAWRGEYPESQLLVNDSRLTRASDYEDRQSSSWSAPLMGDACKNAVIEGRQILAGLNSVLVSHGVEPIADPGVDPGSGGGISDLMGTLKTVAIAAGVIAGVMVIAPLVGDFTAARRAKRRLAGRNR